MSDSSDKWKTVNDKSIDQYNEEIIKIVVEIAINSKKLRQQNKIPKLPKLMLSGILDALTIANNHLENITNFNINRNIQDGGEQIN